MEYADLHVKAIKRLSAVVRGNGIGAKTSNFDRTLTV